ncbi:MAG TPA: preprotein translocase subunit SecG [Thermoanaerobaculia bacterium]|nr:preprotein translocase subunit SecG [Thermoanaerobaculia bacterium]
MIYVLYVLEVVVCLFLILVVLLQQGSGADLSVFGGGATQTAFGARGTTQFIHKLTVWAFVAFIVLTLAISVYKGGAVSASVMSGATTEAPKTKAPAKPAPQPARPPAPRTP